MRTFLIALMLAVSPLFATVAGAAAGPALAQMAWFEGRVVQMSVVSVGIVDATTGKTVHFHLEPFFDEVFSASGAKASMKRVRLGSMVKVFYDRKFKGTRRAERIEIR